MSERKRVVPHFSMPLLFRKPFETGGAFFGSSPITNELTNINMTEKVVVIIIVKPQPDKEVSGTRGEEVTTTPTTSIETSGTRGDVEQKPKDGR